MKAVTITAAMLILLGAGCAKTAANAPASASADICKSPPATTAIGSVEYPVAAAYSNLRGLGMVLTAADCGAARLGQIKKDLDYGQVGGRFTLKAAPSSGLRAALGSLKFACVVSGTPESCLIWDVGEARVDLDGLLKLRPFIGEIGSEDCSSCG